LLANLGVTETIAPASAPETGDAAPPRLADEDYPFLSPPQQPDEIGRLGRYRVRQVLGSGGMGIVFEAEDTQLRRRVALKVMKPSVAAKEANRQRFLREAQTTAAIDHEHIVTVFHVDEADGIPYLAMQLLQGESLHDRLDREGGWLPLPEVLRIGRELAEGLAAAHARGLVHRDIKPANVWLEAPRGRVKLLDFGLARVAGDDVRLTQAGVVLGTPAYMAPEQANGRPVDHRGDLFSLGCVLYQQCTGQLPFPGNDTLSILAALASIDPEPPRRVDPAIPAAFSDLLMRLLAKDPDRRPKSARLVAECIKKIECVLAEQRPVAVQEQRPVCVVKQVEPLFVTEEVPDEERRARRKEVAERPAPRKPRRSGVRHRPNELARLAVLGVFGLVGLGIVVIALLLCLKLLR
jgi:serine/threonine protein kinase